MKVADILSNKVTDVVTIAPDRTLWDAASLLEERKISALVVAGPDGRMRGILTERDLVREACKRPDAIRKTTVQQAMTKEVLVCAPGDNLRSIEVKMRERNVRHLPVFEDQVLAGILTIREVMFALYSATLEDANALRDELARHYVVC